MEMSFKIGFWMFLGMLLAVYLGHLWAEKTLIKMEEQDQKNDEFAKYLAGLQNPNGNGTAT